MACPGVTSSPPFLLDCAKPWLSHGVWLQTQNGYLSVCNFNSDESQGREEFSETDEQVYPSHRALAPRTQAFAKAQPNNTSASARSKISSGKFLG